MRQVTITVYTYDELNEKSQANARNWYRAGALNYEWWEPIYEDAERIGLKIKGFDLERSTEGDLTVDLEECIKRVLSEHGKSTETHKLAEAFDVTIRNQKQLDEQAITDGMDPDEVADDQLDWLAEQEQDFVYALREEYGAMLQKEHDDLLSDEAVAEALLAGEYEFTADGRTA